MNRERISDDIRGIPEKCHLPLIYQEKSTIK